MRKRLFSTLLVCCVLAALFPSYVSARVRYGDWSNWSEWSRDVPPSSTADWDVEAESRAVEDVAAHTEYRYGRWVGATVNWCKEYGEYLHGGTYSIEETAWSTVRATDTNTHWLCGHFDWEHSSHIHASGTDHRGYPMWTKYKVDGYSNPDFFWEESRWVDAVSHPEYRYRIRPIYYDYTAYFDANGGSVSPTQKDVTSGERYGDLPTPYREYHDFLGWFTDRDGGTQITPDSPVNLSGDQTLYAHWNYNAPNYTVTFDPDGGSVDPTSKTVTQGERYGDLPTPVRENHIFLGWFTERGGGAQITPDAVVNLSGDQTLYAHWNYNPPMYTVTFDANGGSGSMPPLKVADNGIFVFPKCGFTPPSTPPNAEFDGWLMNGTFYQVGDTVELHADAIAVAQWYGIAVGDILPGWKNAVTVQFSNAVKRPVSVVVCAYSNEGRVPPDNGKPGRDGKMLSCAARTVDSGTSADLSPDTTGAAYLKAFLLSPDTFGKR